jgi:predicted permease
LPRVEEVSLNGHVLTFTFALSILSGIMFGLAPALRRSDSGIHAALRVGGRGLISGRQGMNAIHVVVGLALALSLLIGAGLMIRSLTRLWTVDPGFNARNVIWFSVALRPGLDHQSADTVRARYRELHDRLKLIPGVRAISFSWGSIPLSWDSEALFWMDNQHKPVSEAEMNVAQEYAVEPDYLRVMGLQLKRGRFLRVEDNERAPRVAVVDENLVGRYFRDRDPVGRRMFLKGAAEPLQIVGVVGHVKQWGLDKDEHSPIQAQLYYPFMQMRSDWIQQSARVIDVLMRASGPPPAIIAAVRRSVQEIDSDQVLFGGESMDQILADSLARYRLSLMLLGAFAGIAFLLASAGIYAAISYTVAQRTSEIGIRMAVGAQRVQVLRLILLQAAKIAAIGIALGLMAALGLSKLLTGLLFGVKPADPLTFVAAGVILFATALLASYMPARRAMHIDPITVLR